jgi:hypothetical protein
LGINPFHQIGTTLHLSPIHLHSPRLSIIFFFAVDKVKWLHEGCRAQNRIQGSRRAARIANNLGTPSTDFCYASPTLLRLSTLNSSHLHPPATYHRNHKVPETWICGSVSRQSDCGSGSGIPDPRVSDPH